MERISLVRSFKAHEIMIGSYGFLSRVGSRIQRTQTETPPLLAGWIRSAHKILSCVNHKRNFRMFFRLKSTRC